MPTPLCIVVGPPSHGVTAYASDVAASLIEADPAVRRRDVATAELAETLVADERPARVHLHVTDKLFGSSLEDAAERVERLAALTSLTVTLHDLPQPSDGETAVHRRAAAYRRMARAAHGVVVSSEHERSLLAEHVDDALPRVLVAPLGTRPGAPFASAGSAGSAGSGVDSESAPPAADPSELRVVIAGYVYPGKGHDDAIAACGDLVRRGEAASATVVALGGPSAGHERDVEALASAATAVGVRFEVTGRLGDEAYAAAFHAPVVPLVAHRHWSASRSLLDWAEQGRRAVVADTRYTREMDALRPGSIALYDPESDGALAAALLAAHRDPRSTALPAGTSLAPTLDDTAAAHLAWWREVAP
ncbi:hypothetical protein [Frigoribacterium sp. CFBP9030]|uniref:hypothetical protein n=1 Tax=Frigoribacterium sp. CFBP9030 TaxID=3096537 RepID=UPI002A698988|nr:hypothetical protein [Frigoribacterium sp. CFBP9030]MDY0891909.1 hypothetical protein [Frigoribacterium sp. CFBP9030]